MTVPVYSLFTFFKVALVGLAAIVWLAAHLRCVGVFKIVRAVYAPTVKYANFNGILGAIKGTPRAHYALVAKLKLALFRIVGYVAHRAVVYALHALNALLCHAKVTAVGFHCAVLYA